MAWIYRYTDLADNIIKYVGIVWGPSRTLEQRLKEHEKNDEWCRVRRWKIEYIEEGIDTRSEAEAFESHYIALYETGKYFNKAKVGYGINKYLPEKENQWLTFGSEAGLIDSISRSNNKNELLLGEIKRLESEIATNKERLYALKNENAWIKKSFEDYTPSMHIEFKEKQPYRFSINDIKLYYYITKDDKTTFESQVFDCTGTPTTDKYTVYFSNDTVYYIIGNGGTWKQGNFCLNENSFDYRTIGEYDLHLAFGFFYPNRNIFSEYYMLLKTEQDRICDKHNVYINDMLDKDIPLQDFISERNHEERINVTYEYGEIKTIRAFDCAWDDPCKKVKNNDLYYIWDNGLHSIPKGKKLIEEKCPPNEYIVKKISEMRFTLKSPFCIISQEIEKMINKIENGEEVI